MTPSNRLKPLMPPSVKGVKKEISKDDLDRDENFEMLLKQGVGKDSPMVKMDQTPQEIKDMLDKPPKVPQKPKKYEESKSQKDEESIGSDYHEDSLDMADRSDTGNELIGSVDTPGGTGHASKNSTFKKEEATELKNIKQI